MNYYEMLGVGQDASRAEIAKAYRELMRENHPDKLMAMDPEDRAIGEELAKSAGAAYQVLSNPARRAKYDEELARVAAKAQPAPGPKPAKEPRRVNLADAGSASPGATMKTPSWRSDELEGDGVTRRDHGAVWITLGMLTWAAWGVISIGAWRPWLHVISAVPDPLAFNVLGAAVHLVLTVLILTGVLWRKWGRRITLVLLGFAVLLALAGKASVPDQVFWLGLAAPGIGLLGTLATTLLGPYALLRRRDRRRPASLVDSEQFITVGSRSLGPRPEALEALIGNLVRAFDGLSGVRVMVLPDRMSVPQVKSQAVIVIGNHVHLLAVPQLGAGGFEVAGSQVVASGHVLRNVVLDELAQMRRELSSIRGVRVFGYVVPAQIADLEIQQIGPLTYGTLSDVIEQIGQTSLSRLRRPDVAVRRRAHQGITSLLSPAELG